VIVSVELIDQWDRTISLTVADVRPVKPGAHVK